MYKYEFGHIIECESKKDEEIQQVIGEVRQMISDLKGRIVKEDVWGKRELTYPIKKQNNGFYMFTTMMMEPLAIFPIPMANPPIDITVSAIPKMSIKTNAMSIEMGIVKDAINAVLKSHIKKIITRTMSPAPTKMENWTCSRDFRIKVDWS